MGSDLQNIFRLAAKYFYKKYKESGGNQAEIAKKLGINQSYVSAVINGSKTASLELQNRLANILYGPFEEFLAVGRRIQNNLDPEEAEQPVTEESQKEGVEKLIAQLTHYVVDYQRIKKELVSTKKFYEDIVQNLQSGVLVTDNDDTIYFANNFMFNIAGLPPDRFLGVDILALYIKFPSMESAEFSAKYLAAKESLEPLYYENISVKTPRGIKTYLSGWMIPYVNEGIYNGMTCTIRDTSKSRELSMLLKITLDNSPDAIGISKKSAAPEGFGPIYFTNRKMRQLFGQNESDYMNITIQESLDKCEKFILNKKEWREFLHKHSSGRTTGSLIIKHKNGKLYRWTSANLLDNEGKLWGTMATVKEAGNKRRKGDK
jgi:transcriptional regulator with XRE-family HTH domain